MRNPARIDRILKLLKEYWDRPGYQDMRLGQIIYALHSFYTKEYRDTGDVFNFEDEDLERILADRLED
jgi:hypothetical protein